MWAAKVTGWELACRKARFWKGLVLLTTRKVLSIFSVEWSCTASVWSDLWPWKGYNGWARPLDQQIQQRGYRLLNVNNLKLARFKEIFPAPAKNDHIDTDKMRLGNRLKADLQAVCPELADLTGSIDNRWFLSFMTARKNLRQLSRLRRNSVLKIKGIGSFYADIIQSWQKDACFSAEVLWVGEMIHNDARRMLELLEQIGQLEQAIEPLTQSSEMAQRIGSIPGFGIICSARAGG